MVIIAQERIELLNKRIEVAKAKLDKLTRQDKASWVFLVTGILLICSGFILIGLIYDSDFSNYLLFFLGFLSTEFLLVGYSLMHKCLRGAWL